MTFPRSTKGRVKHHHCLIYQKFDSGKCFRGPMKHYGNSGMTAYWVHEVLVLTHNLRITASLFIKDGKLLTNHNCRASDLEELSLSSPPMSVSRRGVLQLATSANWSTLVQAPWYSRSSNDVFTLDLKPSRICRSKAAELHARFYVCIATLHLQPPLPRRTEFSLSPSWWRPPCSTSTEVCISMRLSPSV